MQRLILTVKTFQGISNLTISADLPVLLVPEESLNLKNRGQVLKNTLSEHYNTLQLSIP